MMAGIYGTGPKGKATRLHAEIVRARGRCERCGSVDRLQCAHIVSRRYNATRTDLANAWCLCARCHLALTHDPLAHVEFAIATLGEHGYRQLRDRAHAGARIDWQAEADRLTEHARAAR